MRISTRGRTPPFIAMDVMAEARRVAATGRDIVHMEVGEPFPGAPAAARAALAAALEQGTPLGYTQGAGLPELRAGIADLYRRRHGLRLDPGRVIVTSGSSAGFMLAFLGLFDAGARVALADPAYPCYRNMLHALALETVTIPTSFAERYQPTPLGLKSAGRLDGLLIASPANPTGTMLDRAQLKALADVAAGQGATLISDEVYHGLTYEAPAVSALEVTDDAVVVNGFSKYYAMTGWRVGWMVVPEEFVAPLETLAQNFYICPPHASQLAALGALSPEGEAEAAAHLRIYAENRQAVMAVLPRLGFTDIAPADGAFYAYAGLGELAGDSRDFCRRLLEEAGVAATPGLDFDPGRGARTVRFSFAATPERIAEGLRRLERFLKG